MPSVWCVPGRRLSTSGCVPGGVSPPAVVCPRWCGPGGVSPGGVSPSVRPRVCVPGGCPRVCVPSGVSPAVWCGGVVRWPLQSLRQEREGPGPSVVRVPECRPCGVSPVGACRPRGVSPVVCPPRRLCVPDGAAQVACPPVACPRVCVPECVSPAGVPECASPVVCPRRCGAVVWCGGRCNRYGRSVRDPGPVSCEFQNAVRVVCPRRHIAGCLSRDAALLWSCRVSPR